MEPIQVSFTSKYIDGAQTVISATPIAHAETSLTWLANALATTNTGAFSSAEHTWHNLANTVTTVINDVRQAASNLAANNQRPLGINSQTPW